MEARWKEVARSGPTRRSTACADRRSRSRSHTRHTVGAGAAVRVAVTPLLPSCPHRHPPAVGRRPDIASTQISKNHPAPWANFPGSGGRMAKTVTVQSEQSDIRSTQPPNRRTRHGRAVEERALHDQRRLLPRLHLLVHLPWTARRGSCRARGRLLQGQLVWCLLPPLYLHGIRLLLPPPVHCARGNPCAAGH